MDTSLPLGQIRTPSSKILMLDRKLLCAVSVAASLLLTTRCATSAGDLSCPDTQGIEVQGEFTLSSNPEEQQAIADQSWTYLVTNNELGVQAEAPLCTLENATSSALGACSQVAEDGSTNWRVHLNVALSGCELQLSVQAQLAQPAPGTGVASPVVTDFGIAKIPIEIPVYGQCGGSGSNCSAHAKKMGLLVSEVCANIDWPLTYCAEGSECQITDKWYRQCMPSTSPAVHCPAAVGGVAAFAANADVVGQQLVADAVWAYLRETGSTAVPEGSDCDFVKAKAEPQSACSQVVEGVTHWITEFKVSFPGSCSLYMRIDAHVEQPLPEQGDMLVTATRVAPYDSSEEYEKCEVAAEGEGEACRKVVVIPLWGQCGGTGNQCADVVMRLGEAATEGLCTDAPFSSTECAWTGSFPSKCMRIDETYWQCVVTAL